MQQFMKQTAFLILFASAVAAVANAQSDSIVCNDKLIAGVYGFTLEGAKLALPNSTGPVGAQVGVAMTEFFGDGSLQQVDSVTINGIHISNLSETPATGSYTVNPNCTGNFILNFSDKRPTVYADFVIVDNGNEIDTVVTGVLAPDGVTILPALATRSIGKRRLTGFFDPSNAPVVRELPQ